MRLGFVFDTRFIKYNEAFYSVSLSPDAFTERYLSIFDELVVVGRYKEVYENPSDRLMKSSTSHITFQCVEDKHPLKRILNFRKDSNQIRAALKSCDAVICRGWRGTSICRQLNKPYLVEVVNCAWDSYWNHGVLGKLVAPIMYMLRRITTQKAPYVLYVTNEFLQRRYPTEGKAIGISDVALQEFENTDILKRRLLKIKQKKENEKIIIGTAGAVNVRFKGQRFVIEALAKLKKLGFNNFEYQIAGGGSNLKLKKLAEKLGVTDQVVFRGSIVHDEMFLWYDSLDVYIQPSLQEGLPRAVIEAMSRGLPCYGTKTGGIPELIERSCVCRSRYHIAQGITQFLLDHTALKAAEMAKRNFREAQKYRANMLNNQRHDFLVEFSKSVTGE